MSLFQTIQEYHSLELEAHISPDDAIAKAYEEAHELSVAFEENNQDEIQKEARDVLVNILSVSSRYIDIETLPDVIPPESIDIHALVARWGRETASIRKRYSRETPSYERYALLVSEIIAYLLSLIGSSANDAVISSIEKFRTRIQAYLPDIHLEDYIEGYPDFPKPWILFRDIAPLLADPEALRYTGFELAKRAQNADIIAWLDARGFIFGTLVAQILEKPFVMIRKKWKLPWETVGTDYSLEYGDNSIEIQKDAIKPGERVVIIDDLLATGGTFLAAASLVEKVGGKVEKLLAVISLDESELLNHPSRQTIQSYPSESILSYT